MDPPPERGVHLSTYSLHRLGSGRAAMASATETRDSVGSPTRWLAIGVFDPPPHRPGRIMANHGTCIGISSIPTPSCYLAQVPWAALIRRVHISTVQSRRRFIRRIAYTGQCPAAANSREVLNLNTRYQFARATYEPIHAALKMPYALYFFGLEGWDGMGSVVTDMTDISHWKIHSLPGDAPQPNLLDRRFGEKKRRG